MGDRAIPEFNRVICQRAFKQNKAKHYVNLRSIQKAVDNDLPFTMTYKRPKDNSVGGKLTWTLNSNNFEQKDALRLKSKTECC